MSILSLFAPDVPSCPHIDALHIAFVSFVLLIDVFLPILCVLNNIAIFIFKKVKLGFLSFLSNNNSLLQVWSIDVCEYRGMGTIY